VFVQATSNPASLSVEEYLAGERRNQIRHEFIGGVVYAMAGTSHRHNIICLNLAFAIRSHLRDGPCQVFMENIKLRLQIATEDIFYYPDLMVICDPRDTDAYFNRFPKVLIEVLSPETERIDRREKFSSYTQIETLEEYILVAQDSMEVTTFRRVNQWRPELANQPDQELCIPSIGFALSLPAIYER
jgi:Uma2 family endonuclease